MKNKFVFMLIFILIFTNIFPSTKITDKDFVKVREYIPNIYVDLKYSTTDNFTKQKIYDFSEAYLRYGTVKKLLSVQKKLNKKGYSLKIWDAYRPVYAQFKLWEAANHDSNFVVDPTKHYSPHNNGNTVDITIVAIAGNEIPMPTGFDTFNKKADRDYSDVSAIQKKNALILENAMKEIGFIGYSKEWWHYRDKNNYPVAKDTF